MARTAINSAMSESSVWLKRGAQCMRMAGSPTGVTALTLLIYTLWTVNFFVSGHDARDLTFMGLRLLRQSHVSSVITIDPRYHYYPNGIGYDGQYYYYLALDPRNAHLYMDWPAYRYERILYPMLARLLALGQPTLIPYTLLLVNWLAIGGGTFIVAAWLKRRNLSPWLALIYAFYPGLLLSFQHDLAEPLAYGFTALGVYLYDVGDRFGGRRLVLAGFAFGLATLARETTAVFAFVYAAALLLAPSQRRLPWFERVRARWRQALPFTVCALGPFAVYKGFLALWLGSTGTPQEVVPTLLPFQGLFELWPWNAQQIIGMLVVVAPGLICAMTALWAIWQGAGEVHIGLLLVQVVFFVVLLPYSTYFDIYSTERVATGVMLAAIYCIPLFDRVTGKNRSWLLASAGLWLAVVPWLLTTNFFWWSHT